MFQKDFSEYAKNIGRGWAVMLATAPGIIPLNYASNKAATNALWPKASLKAISPMPFKGWKEHFAKETPRAVSKVFSLTEFRPWINKQLPKNPYAADFFFALGTSLATEIPVNPFEVARVQMQNGLPVQGLMRGVGFSVARQMPIWSLFSTSYRWCNKTLEENGHNPFQYKFIPAKAFTTTCCFSPATYLFFGRIRYELQNRTCLSAIAGEQVLGKVTVKNAAMAIYKEQGPRGFVFGITEKFISDFILAMGAIFVSEYGKGSQSK